MIYTKAIRICHNNNNNNNNNFYNNDNLYLARHNNALKILFFQVIRALDLVTSEVPWFSKTQPKPMYENERAIAYWGIPLSTLITRT